MKKVVSFILAMVTALSVVLCTGVISFAANYSSNYKDYKEPSNSGDYAYWNGKVIKGANTTKSEIKWMQAALNYCIKSEGLKADLLDVDGSFGPASEKTTAKFQKAAGLDNDGSFGPATIKEMKKVLNDGIQTFVKNDGNSQKTVTSSKTLDVDMKLIKKTGYQPESGPCGCYALAYCNVIIDDEAHSWTEYSNEGYLKSKGRYGYTVNWGKGNYTSKTGSSKKAVFKAIYNSINEGEPVIIRVKGNGSKGHYVAVVGYKNVNDINNLSEKNFLIIDSASKTAFNRGITSMTSGSTGYKLHDNLQYVVRK